MQQFLNFLPLPQGQGSLRPTFFLASGLRGSVSRGVGGKEGLAFATSAAFLPVSFSRANSSRPLGSASSSLTRRQCSSFLGLLGRQPLVVFGKPFPRERVISSR